MEKLRFLQKIALGACISAAVCADDVVIHNEVFDLTAKQVLTELQAQPQELQKKLKANEDAFRKFVDAIYNESIYAIEADKQKLQADPLVQDKIAIATRKVLVEELGERKLRSIHVPEMEPLALADYQAHPENFMNKETVRARHILLRFDDSNKAEKKQLLQTLAQRVAAGEDFAALAKQFSSDKGSAEKGGDLGEFGKGQMVPEFEQAAFALTKPKQLSEIVETKFGWHLIQLTEHKPSQAKPFAEVKAQLIGELEQEYIKNEMKSWRLAMIDPAKAKLNEAELVKLINDVKKLPAN